MLTNSTVLLLGAGASAPYGYPTGAELRRKIIEGITKPRPGDLKTTMLRLGFSEEELVTFATTFHASQQYSIDAYLQRQPRFRNIATHAIAAILLQYENRDSLLREGDGRWYQYLFNRLESIGAFFKMGTGRKSLSIITWNYDRSLQFYLHTALKNSYGLSNKEAATELNKLAFLHLHGNLGPLPFYSVDPNQTCYEYGAEISDQRIRIAAANINIIHDQSIEESRFTEAKTRLYMAQHVVVMGTSFHPLNFERLEPKNWGSSILRGGVSTVVSMKGIPNSEQPDIFSQFKNPCPRPDSDCLETLREHKILY